MLLRRPREPELADVFFDTLETSGVHEFWLFREGERDYTAYSGLHHKDAPLLLSDRAASFLSETFSWVPSMNPANRNEWHGSGLNYFGPTVFNKEGGEALRGVCAGWAQLLSQGPEVLVLPDGWYTLSDEKPPQIKPHHFKTNRDPFVQRLKTLADWGEKAATGAFFILHLGI